jgi:hypothetical protein
LPTKRAAHETALHTQIGRPPGGYRLFSIATAEQAGEEGHLLKSSALPEWTSTPQNGQTKLVFTTISVQPASRPIGKTDIDHQRFDIAKR